MPNQWTKKREQSSSIGDTTPIEDEEESTIDNPISLKQQQRDSNATQVAHTQDDEDNNNEILETSLKTPPKDEKQQGQQKRTKGKITIMPLAGYQQAYEKAGIPYPRIPSETEREVFERQTKGNWTREVKKIVLYRDTNEKQFLDWSEKRCGKTGMQREAEKTIPHVARGLVIVAKQEVRYDPDADENKLVNTGTEKDQYIIPGIPYSKEALDELLEDVSKSKCEYVLHQEGTQPISITKKDLQKYTGDFEKLYNKKSNVPLDND